MAMIMKSLGPALFIAVVSATATAQTATKPLPAPRGSAEIPSRPLLLEPRVQKDIGLTSKQKNNLAELEAEVDASRQGFMNEAGDEAFDFQAMMSGAEEVERQRRSAVAKLLTQAQKARLLQIEWQREGWLALGRPEVATRLQLSQAQLQQIQSIIRSMRQAQAQNLSWPLDGTTPPQNSLQTTTKLNPSNGFIDNSGTLLRGGGPASFNPDQSRAQAEKTFEAAEIIRTKFASEVDKILTPEQKVSFEKLLGPFFDFQSLGSTPRAQSVPDAAARSRRVPPKKTSKPH